MNQAEKLKNRFGSSLFREAEVYLARLIHKLLQYIQKVSSYQLAGLDPETSSG
jgi:hypothetical protein